MAGNTGLEQDIRSAPLLSDAERFRLLSRLLDNEDLRVLAQFPARASQLRKGRARIFGGEIGLIRREVNVAFLARLHRIGECGRWSRIFGLVADTASAYAALSKLGINGALFRFSVPGLFATEPNTQRLCRYFTLEFLTVADRA